ncbi:aminotransferase class V-fold PLP-dependent enzyme [Candidatus Formimonas warabiya]|uniref:cysteine desulfurase n=1 Tax=Formimonas warabiya TaxID=1761012 RepID=A0A3G1KPB7_FORW1|nr:aminotransferase class V-fold PLP-dependent enzyme [Candidatus Formimonas warabiya]ATW24313.1 cysteine desulfurase [Candidatus Formimonas warabiya]
MPYFDNAATSFPKPEEVYREVEKYLRVYGANPGRSGHKMALQAGRVIFETRELLAKLFHIDDPMQVIFTSNATAALNLAIKGYLKRGDHVLLTSMEHNSVIRPIKALENMGVEHTIVTCAKDGALNPEDMEKALKSNSKMIISTHASNVTGTLMPVQEIGTISQKNHLAFLLDASQTAGVYDLDVNAMNIDMMAFPGHKSLLGPQGTGGLYIRKGLELCEMIQGGTGSKSDRIVQPEMMPDRYESGTLNTPGIAGLGAGIKFILRQGMDEIRHHESDLTNYLLEKLAEIKKVDVYGPMNTLKQAPVVSLNIRGMDSSEVAYELDSKYDIAVRPGLHCAPLAHETIGTLEQGTVRFSIGYFNTKENVDQAVNALYSICRG